MKYFSEKILKAQATLEFTFGMLATLLLLSGMVQLILWTGNNLAARRLAYEESVTRDESGLEQTKDKPFYYASSMNVAVPGNIFGYDY